MLGQRGRCHRHGVSQSVLAVAPVRVQYRRVRVRVVSY